MKKTTVQNRIRLWAVAAWLTVWQGTSMALRALYPHGELLLASPIDAAVRLLEMAVTADFWLVVGASAARIFGTLRSQLPRPFLPRLESYSCEN